MSVGNIGWKLLLASVTAAWAGAVVAQQGSYTYTFQVPVDLRDMHPDIRPSAIACQINDAQGGSLGNGGSEFQIDPQTRSFNGTVSVSVQLLAGKSPLDAVTYQCVLVLADQSTGATWRADQGGLGNSTAGTKFQPADGAVFTPGVSGPMQPQQSGFMTPRKAVKQ